MTIKTSHNHVHTPWLTPAPHLAITPLSPAGSGGGLSIRCGYLLTTDNQYNSICGLKADLFTNHHPCWSVGQPGTVGVQCTQIQWGKKKLLHYSDVIMGSMASQITRVSVVYSTVRLRTDQRKHQSSVSLAFVRGVHRWPVNGEFLAQRASNAENVSIWWRHHAMRLLYITESFLRW